ncbi:MAG TPA: hypothetical protein VJ306_15890 [Pyrinomonadaceae bacterium]|jgi:cell division protein YceG involved in septum cleavage|nr:hypothetical protein [Pyrinomonadaceae bacterium]
MKSIVNRMLVVMLVGALTSVAAFAKVRKQRVTFDNDIKVNGTLVKKGTYDLKFDDETGQLSIVKNGKTVAQAMARTEDRQKKAGDFQLRSEVNGGETQLIGVTFGGSDKNVVITNGGATTTGNN